MKPRLIVFAAAILVVVVSSFVWFAATRPPACSANGNPDPIELKIASTPTRVQACFGEGCHLEPLQPQSDGRWMVPQEPPFVPVSQEGPNPVRDKVRVVVKEAGKRQRDVLFDIPKTDGAPVAGSQCPGPVTYLPVAVP